MTCIETLLVYCHHSMHYHYLLLALSYMLTLSSTLIIKDFLTSVFMWQEENQIGEEKVTVGTNTCSHSKKGTHDGGGGGGVMMVVVIRCAYFIS